MDNNDKKYDIDSLIEEAFIEKGARKQLEALEKQIREKERREAKARQWWIGVVAGVAAGAAVVVLNVIQPWNNTSDVTPGTGTGGTLTEVTGGTPEPLNGGSDGSGQETQSETGNGQNAGNAGTEKESTKDASSASIELKAQAACRNYIASLEPFRSGTAESLDADIARAVSLLKEGKSAEEALELLKECGAQIGSQLSELESHNDDNSFDKKQELEQQKEDVQWLTALAYLSLGETDQAKSLLETLSKGDGQYSADASKLLAEVFTTE